MILNSKTPAGDVGVIQGDGCDRGKLWHDVYKDPKSDSTKASKSGRLKLIKRLSMFKIVRLEEDGEDILRTVFRNGEMLRLDTLDAIKERAAL